MPLMLRKKTWLTLICLLFTYHDSFAAWRPLTKGIEYEKQSTNNPTPWSYIHVFRIDTALHPLALVTAEDLSRLAASAKEFGELKGGLISINGGFFDEHYQPLGLRIDHRQQKSPLKKISWWGVFYMKDKKPHISNIRRFKEAGSIDLAIQSGPRLVINGKIPPLKPGRAQRSALGISKEGYLIILITENTPLSTEELAKILKAPPLSCQYALNLDGGSSSQLYAKVQDFQLNVYGFSKVSDAIVVNN